MNDADPLSAQKHGPASSPSDPSKQSHLLPLFLSCNQQKFHKKIKLVNLKKEKTNGRNWKTKTHVYSFFLTGTELRPMPRLSNAQTSIPPPPSPLSTESWSMVSSSSLGLSVPANPFSCGPHASCVPANPEPNDDHAVKIQN